MLLFVMAGLVPAINVFLASNAKDVDARHKVYTRAGRRPDPGAGHAGLASADVVLNALARRQQPAPSTPIAVPERLALKLPPIADCARYDALRAEAPAMEGLHGAL